MQHGLVFHCLARDQCKRRLTAVNPVCESHSEPPLCASVRGVWDHVYHVCECDTREWTGCSIKRSHLRMPASRYVGQKQTQHTKQLRINIFLQRAENLKGNVAMLLWCTGL